MRRSLPSCRRLRPRHAQGGRAANIWGIGVDADEYNVAKRDPDERRQEDRHGRVRRDPAGAVRTLQGRQDLLFDLKNNGMGVGKINPAVPIVVDQADEHATRADHLRQAEAADGPSASGRVQEGGPSARPPSSLGSPGAQRRARSRDAGHPQGVPGTSSPTTTSRSTCAAARCMRSSARTAPGSRR